MTRKVSSKKTETHTAAFFTRCSPKSMQDVIRTLTESQEKVVKKMGFGGLLRLNCGQMKLRFCKKLVERFDTSKKCLLIGGTSTPITANDVHYVLGVPIGEKIFDIKEKINFINDLETFKGIDVKGLRDLIRDGSVDESFRRAFILFALARFLCPTSKMKPSPKLLQTIDDVSDPCIFNWGQLVLDWLVEEINTYRKRDGKKSIGGCMFFLLVFYFHKFPVVSVKVNADPPLIKNWGRDEILDRIHYEQKQGLLSRAGEEVDPLWSHEQLKDEITRDVFKQVMENILKPLDAKLIKLRTTCSRCSCKIGDDYGETQDDDEDVEGDDDEDEGRNKDQRGKKQVEEKDFEKPKNEEGKEKTKDKDEEGRNIEQGDKQVGVANEPQEKEAKEDVGIEDKGRKRVTFQLEGEEKNKDKDEEEERNIAKRKVFLTPSSAKTDKQVGAINEPQKKKAKIDTFDNSFITKKNLFDFCTLDQGKGSDDSVMVQMCNGFLRKFDCKSMGANKWVSNIVMSFAAKVFMKKEKDKKGVISRHIFSSNFMLHVLCELGKKKIKWDVKNVQKEVKPLKEQQYLENLELIFFPTLRNSHWYCYVLEITTKKLYVLDSLGQKNTSTDMQVKGRLQEVFKDLNPNLMDASIEWEIVHVKVGMQENGFDCGVYVLKYMELWGPNEEQPHYKQKDILKFRREFIWAWVKDQENEVRKQVLRRATNWVKFSKELVVNGEEHSKELVMNGEEHMGRDDNITNFVEGMGQVAIDPAITELRRSKRQRRHNIKYSQD